MTSTSSISIGYPSIYFILNSSITPFVTYVTYVTPFVTYITPVVTYVTYVIPKAIIFLFIARKTSCSINSGSLHLVLDTHNS